MFSDDCDWGFGFVVVVEDVHIVCVEAATAPEEEIEGCALGGCECARKAARKVLRNGLWVGMLVEFFADLLLWCNHGAFSSV